MTTPRRPLSEAQLAQRRAASQAAAERRRTRGLTPAELAQRQAASERAAERLAERRRAEPERFKGPSAQEIRARAWAQPEARRVRRIQRREFNAEAREIGAQFSQAIRDGRIGEAEILALDVREANRRALEVRGVSVSQARDHGLLTEDWNSKGVQNVLRKLDNLLAKGLTVNQALKELEQRAHRIQDFYREARSNDLMILAREFYTREQRERRLERRRDQSRRRRQRMVA